MSGYGSFQSLKVRSGLDFSPSVDSPLFLESWCFALYIYNKEMESFYPILTIERSRIQTGVYPPYTLSGPTTKKINFH